MTPPPGSRLRAALAAVLALALLAAIALALGAEPPASVRPPSGAHPDVLLCLNGDPDFGRVRRTVALAALHPDALVLVSGGGVAGDNAWYLAGAAIALGLPPARLRIEPLAASTHENFALSRPLLDALGARSVLVVTSRVHARRAALSAQALLPHQTVWLDAIDTGDFTLRLRLAEFLKTLRYVLLGQIPWRSL